MYEYSGCRQVAVIARLDGNGNPDPTFGDRGFVTLPEIICDRGSTTGGRNYRAGAPITPREDVTASFRRARTAKPRLNMLFRVDPMPTRLTIPMPKGIRMTARAVKRVSVWRGGDLLPAVSLTRSGSGISLRVGDGKGYAPVRVLFRAGSLKPLRKRALHRTLRFEMTVETAEGESALSYRTREVPRKRKGSPSR